MLPESILTHVILCIVVKNYYLVFRKVRVFSSAQEGCIFVNWSVPTLEILERVKPSNYFGCDTSLAHIFLWRSVTNILVSEQDGVLFRYYQGSKSNGRGYGFPLGCSVKEGAAFFSMLKRDAKMRDVPLEFCLFDETQIKAIEKFCDIQWQSFSGDSDYIYNQENLATLAGRKLHGKKNHVNRFFRLYPEAEYRIISENNKADAVNIAEQWIAEHKELNEDTSSEESELKCIKEALTYMEKMRLLGGILYIADEPVAFTLASRLSDQCLDVHFEKAVGNYARDGAYAVINQSFASSEEVSAYKYINREEDMELPGLRKAKESYHPAFKVKKYSGRV